MPYWSGHPLLGSEPATFLNSDLLCPSHYSGLTHKGKKKERARIASCFYFPSNSTFQTLKQVPSDHQPSNVWTQPSSGSSVSGSHCKLSQSPGLGLCFEEKGGLGVCWPSRRTGFLIPFSWTILRSYFPLTDSSCSKGIHIVWLIWKDKLKAFRYHGKEVTDMDI